MEQQKKIFYSKLQDMSKDYEQLYCRISFAQNHSKHLDQDIASVKREIEVNNLLLRDTVAHSSSPALSMLASIHLNYCEQMDALRKTLDKYMGETHHEQAEALALYAEHAMDFATQAIRFALLAALEAIHIQPEETEENV